jgi:hypothetical protein
MAWYTQHIIKTIDKHNRLTETGPRDQYRGSLKVWPGSDTQCNQLMHTVP